MAQKPKTKNQKPFVVCSFDTETTGLIENQIMAIDKQPEIIEFYAQKFDYETGKKIAELDLLLKPQRPISSEITAITGIDNDMVAGAPSYRQKATEIISFLTDCDLLIGHNLSFDMEMIFLEQRRIELPALRNERLLCTVEQTIHLKGIRLKLGDLYELLFSKPLAGAHRARNDVEAQIACFMELKKRGNI